MYPAAGEWLGPGASITLTVGQSVTAVVTTTVVIPEAETAGVEMVEVDGGSGRHGRPRRAPAMPAASQRFAGERFRRGSTERTR